MSLLPNSIVRGSRSPGTYVSFPIYRTKIPVLFLYLSQAIHPNWIPSSLNKFSSSCGFPKSPLASEAPGKLKYLQILSHRITRENLMSKTFSLAWVLKFPFCPLDFMSLKKQSQAHEMFSQYHSNPSPALPVFFLQFWSSGEVGIMTLSLCCHKLFGVELTHHR